MKTIVVLSLAALLTACANTQKIQVQAYGVYGQMYVRENPIFEIEYESPQKCADFSNQTIAQMNAQDSTLISSGEIRLVCSSNSLADRLQFVGEVLEVYTNKKYKLRFVSEESCKAAIKIMGKDNPGYSYRC